MAYAIDKLDNRSTFTQEEIDALVTALIDATGTIEANMLTARHDASKGICPDVNTWYADRAQERINRNRRLTDDARAKAQRITRERIA